MTRGYSPVDPPIQPDPPPRPTPGTWHLLVCLDCTKAEVFDTPGERDGWQQAHTMGTGHQRWIVKDQPRGRHD